MAKASFLLSLAQPASFKQENVSKKEEDSNDSPVLGKKPSYCMRSDEDNELDWQKTVTEWRSDLQQLGIFKNRNETLN